MVTCPGQRTTSGAGLALLGDSISSIFVVFLLQVPSLWASRNSHLCLCLHSERLGLPACVLWPSCYTVLGCQQHAYSKCFCHMELSPQSLTTVLVTSLLCSQCLCVNVGVCTYWQRSEDNLRGQVSPSTSMGVHVVRRTRHCFSLIPLALQWVFKHSDAKQTLASFRVISEAGFTRSTSCVFQDNGCIVRESRNCYKENEDKV